MSKKTGKNKELNAKYRKKRSSHGLAAGDKGTKKMRSNHSLNPGWLKNNFSIFSKNTKTLLSAKYLMMKICVIKITLENSERKVSGKTSGSGPTMRSKSTINRLRMYKNFKPIRFESRNIQKNFLEIIKKKFF